MYGSNAVPVARDEDAAPQTTRRQTSGQFGDKRTRYTTFTVFDSAVASKRLSESSVSYGQGTLRTTDTEESETKATPFSVNQILTLITLCSSSVCSSLFSSLLAPFFPTEAVSKGASPTEAGLIFACYQLIIFLVAPVYGHFLMQIGWKFMFVTGILVCSTCAILFGFLEYCPKGTIYVVMCFLVRSVEALGGAATITSMNAIAANKFGGRVSTVYGILQGCSAAGLMAGPPLGGVLYSAGGFKLPFLVTGSFYMLAGLVSWRLLPSDTVEKEETSGDKLALFRIPKIYAIGILVFVGQFAIGFIDVGLAIDLQKYNLSPALIGLVFLIPSGLIVLLAPLYGWISDHKGYSNVILIYGAVLGAAGFVILGPAPFLPDFIPRDTLWVQLVGLVVAGIAWGSIVVCFNVFIQAAIKKGLPDSMETHGIVSGTFNALNSSGAFAGPIVGGALLQSFGFPWSSTIIAAMIALAGLNLVVFTIVSKSITYYSQKTGKGSSEESKPSLPKCMTTEKGTDKEKALLLSEQS